MDMSALGTILRVGETMSSLSTTPGREPSVPEAREPGAASRIALNGGNKRLDFHPLPSAKFQSFVFLMLLRAVGVQALQPPAPFHGGGAISRSRPVF